VQRQLAFSKRLQASCLRSNMTNLQKIFELSDRIGRPPKFAFTPSEVFCEFDKVKVLKYLPTTETTHPIPILLVPSLINKYYILDLLPNKSYVEFLVNQGFSVYLIDWGVVDDADKFWTLERYIQTFLRKAVKKIRKAEYAEKVSMIGYCMGGTMALIYTVLFPQTVANLILLATPVDFHNNSMLSVWAKPEYFNVDKLVDSYGNIPVSLLQSAFQMLKPVQTFTRYANLYENAENEEFVESFLAFDYWANDAIPVAGETFRKFIKDCFQDNLLIKNRMTMNGEVVDLQQVTCSVLNVIAQHDSIVPPESAEALMDKIGSTDAEMVKAKGGHHGITIGTSAMNFVWKKTADWMLERQY
jgi:polyhydroxyalkanoate synthase